MRLLLFNSNLLIYYKMSSLADDKSKRRQKSVTLVERQIDGGPYEYICIMHSACGIGDSRVCRATFPSPSPSIQFHVFFSGCCCSLRLFGDVMVDALSTFRSRDERILNYYYFIYLWIIHLHLILICYAAAELLLAAAAAATAKSNFFSAKVKKMKTKNRKAKERVREKTMMKKTKKVWIFDKKLFFFLFVLMRRLPSTCRR